jgi:hypothetical protein
VTKFKLEFFMKNLALVALITSISALSACSKPANEVKAGDKTLSPASAAAIAHPASSAQNAPFAVTQSNDPTAILKSDIQKIQTFGAAQEQKATQLEQRMSAAVQKEDKAALKKLLPEFKAFVEQSNRDFNALTLNSTEAQQLRSKMTQSSSLGLEMSEKMLADKPDQKALQALQEKIVQSQQELMAISQEIHSKIAPPQAAASAAQAAPKAQ